MPKASDSSSSSEPSPKPASRKPRTIEPAEAAAAYHKGQKKTWEIVKGRRRS
ncbi:hypothetical protein [Streptomyces noursei]|uniref:hypothetical protein n=1 Tax=Streptomyces noursei TaxID=1971 RepID=UPI0038161A25